MRINIYILYRFLMLFLATAVIVYTIPTASADLQIIYQSDDKDEKAPSNVSNLSLEDLAKYYDYAFNIPPLREVAEQNLRALNAFPLKGNDESAVPYGTPTKSKGVIKDAYIKLIPIDGLIKTPNGFYPDKVARVGYLVDYRIQLPPDVTDHYPKHYYSVNKESVKVIIKSGDQKKVSQSKRDVVKLKIGDSVKAEATISVTIKETIIELHTSCETECDENGNCTTHCHTYEVRYTEYHDYSLTVSDIIPIYRPKEPAKIYQLLKNGNPCEYWIIPNDMSTYISTGSTVIVNGLHSFTTYRVIKQVTYKTSRGSSTSTLDDPFYYLAVLPSYDIIPRMWTCTILNESCEVKTVDYIPNFKPLSQLKDCKSIRIMWNNNITLLDPFGNPIKTERIVKKLVPVEIKFSTLKYEGKNAYLVKGYASYDNIPYNGPIYITYRGQLHTINVTNGEFTILLNGSGTLSYKIPRNLPNDWYLSPQSSFPDETVGTYEIGKEDWYTLGWWTFVILLSTALPFYVAYYLFRKYYLEEEGEDYI